MRQPIRVFASAICLTLAAGCLPSAPEAPKAAQPAAAPTAVQPPPPAAAPAPAPAAAPAETPTEAPKAAAGDAQPNRPSLNFDTTGRGGVDVEVSTEPLEGGAYRVTGSFGLDATITRTGEGRWTLAGQMEFPTGGYEVDEPFTIPLTDVAPGPDGVKVTASKVQVVVQIPVRIPPTGAMVTQALEQKKLHFEFDAPNHSTFVVSMTSG